MKEKKRENHLSDLKDYFKGFYSIMKMKNWIKNFKIFLLKNIHWTGWFLNLQTHQNPLVDLCKQISGPILGVFESVSLERGMIICISYKFPGDADAADPKTTHWNSHHFKQMNRRTWELPHLQYLCNSLFFSIQKHCITLMWMRFLPHES